MNLCVYRDSKTSNTTVTVEPMASLVQLIATATAKRSEKARQAQDKRQDIVCRVGRILHKNINQIHAAVFVFKITLQN